MKILHSFGHRDWLIDSCVTQSVNEMQDIWQASLRGMCAHFPADLDMGHTVLTANRDKNCAKIGTRITSHGVVWDPESSHR